MAKVETYRQLIQDVLTEYGKLLVNGSDDDSEVQIIFDTKGDHYQLVYVGFHGKQR